MNTVDTTSTAAYPLDPERLKHVLPDAPGVYLFRESSGRILYVGKAKNLAKRVLSYFTSQRNHSRKTKLMLDRAGGVDFILTATEKESFILEDTLVKKFMPRYNVVLRDDKRFPCLRLDVTEPYPRLTIARRMKKDGALYFGPFSSANSVRRTLKVIDRVFQMRKCKGRELPKRTRPCLNYQMGRCLGACVHEVPREEYHKTVQQVRLFLEGKNRELVAQLKKEMRAAAERTEFERAAAIRDQIAAIERTVERQHVASPRMADQDVIGLAQAEERYQIVVLFVRRGSVTDRIDYLLRNPGGSASEVLEAFLKQFYSRKGSSPGEILIPQPIEDLASIESWISEAAEKRVAIHRPLRGEKRRLLEMAQANAEKLIGDRSETGHSDDVTDLALTTLQLKRPPRHVEGLDISNLQGDQAVGTIVTFVAGLPHPPGYRNYRIKAVAGIDDYAMMAELVSRRLSRGDLPDLFVVDGGKGHLSAVQKAMERNGESFGADGAREEPPDVVAIAKPDEGEGAEKIYLPGRRNPLNLRPDHPVMWFLMRVRDEAHRRAVSYHRSLRSSRATESLLDEIPGIGKKRKRLLLHHFASVTNMAGASVTELEKVPGISRSLAEEIHSRLHGPSQGDLK